MAFKSLPKQIPKTKILKIHIHGPKFSRKPRLYLRVFSALRVAPTWVVTGFVINFRHIYIMGGKLSNQSERFFNADLPMKMSDF